MGMFDKIKNWFTGLFKKKEEEPEIVIQEKQKEEIYKQPEIQEQQIKEQEIVKEEFEIIKRQRTEPQRPIIKEKTETQKFIEQVNKRKRIKDIEATIEDQGINQTKLTGIEELNNLSLLRPQYQKVLMDNAKLRDPEIMEILFENRRKLQHRFTAEIIVDVNGKYGNTLLVIGTLIEDLALKGQFIVIGDKIDSPVQLDISMKGLGEALKQQYGITNYELVNRNAEKGNITDIKINYSFA